MRFFINDLLWDTGVKIGVGFELEDDVQDVHQEQDLIEELERHDLIGSSYYLQHLFHG